MGWIVLCGGFVSAQPDGREIRDAARRVLSSGGYQTEWPVRRPRAPTVFERDVETERERPRPNPDDSAESWSGDGPEWSTIGRVLFWIAVAVFAAFVLGSIFVEVQRKKGQANLRHTPVQPIATPRPAPVPDYERLAGEGRYDEALHAVYLTAVRRLGVTDDSWTGREILAKAGIAGEARRALSEITRAVEFSRFGGQPADEAGYRAALAHLPHVQRGAA